MKIEIGSSISLSNSTAVIEAGTDHPFRIVESRDGMLDKTPPEPKKSSLVIPDEVLQIMTAEALSEYGNEILFQMFMYHPDNAPVDTFEELEEVYEKAREIYNRTNGLQNIS